MCGDCFVCIYLVCQCDGLELGRRNRRITVRGVAVRINIPTFDNSMYYACQENAWMDERVMVMWVEKVLMLTLSQPQKVLFPYCCWILIIVM